MSGQSIDTIVDALNTLYSMHEYVIHSSKSSEAKECALKGIELINGAFSEFEKVLSDVYGRPYVITRFH